MVKKVAKKKTSSKKTRTKRAPRGLTKRQVVEALAEKLDLDKKSAKATLENIEELVQSELKRIGAFSLGNLGKFSVRDRKARKGRNPATGETIKIPAKTVLRFRIAKALKVAVLPEEAKKAKLAKAKRARKKKTATKKRKEPDRR